jgi:hypothetical protein
MYFPRSYHMVSLRNKVLNISRIVLKYGHFSYDGVNDQHMFTKQRFIPYYYITTGSSKLPYCPRYIATGQTAKKTLSERSPTKHVLLYHV